MEINKNILPFKEFHSPSKPYLSLDNPQLFLIKELNRTIEKGAIRFQSVACLCGSKRFDLIASVDSYSILQKTVICRECGLIQSNPRMTEEEYGNFYRSDLYRRCYETDDYLSIAEKRYFDNSGEHILNEVRKFKSDINSSVLEVGAGGGWNLLPFKKYGMAVLGLDYSQALVSLGRSKGINMVQGGIDKISGQFDIIIINHALEHFLDPVASLKEIIKHLKTNGLIYIAVPNIMNFDLGQIQNAHTYYFEPKTFLYYCSLAGLEECSMGVAQKIHIFGIFKPSPRQLPKSYLANHYQEMLFYLNLYKFKQYIKNIIPLSVLRRLRNNT
jgi:SAM-dependent methyltransferase